MIELSWLKQGEILLTEIKTLWTYEDVEDYAVRLSQHIMEADQRPYNIVHIHTDEFPLTTNFARLAGYLKDIPQDQVGELLFVIKNPTTKLIATSVCYILRWKHSMYNSVEDALNYIEQQSINSEIASL